VSYLGPSAGEAFFQGPFVTGSQYFLSLHSGLPSTNGSNEISGGGYARQIISFLSPSVGNIGGATVGVLYSGGSYAAQTFSNLPLESSGLPFIGVWASNTAGTFLGAASTGLTLATSIPSAATVSFAAQQIYFTVS
jgi:hypothetical protein